MRARARSAIRRGRQVRRQAQARLFARLSRGGEANLLDTLRTERTGGVLLLLGAVVALLWANSAGADSYAALRDVVVGPAVLELDLTLEQWATDGLLTVFFFVVGLELKRELVDGELRRPATAAVPIVAAVGGMAVPAIIYVALNARGGGLHGWAIPTATDIAFAVAVLAVVGRHLPNTLRAFLLTLAVVDDLLAIVVIAIFYSSDLEFGYLVVSLAATGVFAVLVRRRVTSPLLLVPLALVAWWGMHSFGVHSTIAGVLLGFCVPAKPQADEPESLAARFEHRWRPVSAGFAVPVFALFAAGVALNPAALDEAIHDPAAQGVALGLVLGKPAGILLATWLTARVTRAALAPGVGWSDVLGLGMVAGVGFTVSLLITDLAFGGDPVRDEHVRAAIMLASLTAATGGGLALAARDRYHRRIAEAGDPRFAGVTVEG